MSGTRLGRWPVAIALGPTYIREERQTVGLLRLQGFSHEKAGRDAKDQTLEYESSSGPIVEVSAEGRDARLRHTRFRYQYTASLRDYGTQATLHGFGYADVSLFRSRFFTDSRDPDSAGGGALGPRRGNAYGFDVGAGFSVQTHYFAWSMEGATGLNRPELLAIVPSAAARAELRLTTSLRLQY